MRLYGSGHSPFVRKIRILAGELGLSDQVSFAAAEGTPMDPPGLRVKNPLKKIPFLEMADGRVLFDSRVAAEAFLQAADAAAAARALPAGGAERLEVLTRQALFDGLCDAAVSIAYEKRLRPEPMQWAEWLEMQWGKVVAALDWAETSPGPDGRFDLGDCALAAALIYLDLRFADRDWRAGRPGLSRWDAAARERPAVAATLS